MSSSDSCSTETSSDDPGGVMIMHYCQGGKKQKNTVHLQLWGEINLAAICTVAKYQKTHGWSDRPVQGQEKCWTYLETSQPCR